LRYDMGRRPSEPPADGPDVTSTGMSTFGGTAWDSREMPVAGRMPAPRRSPRRGVAVSALGLLTVLGAAAAYLVVVNGLVPMRDEKPAAAGTLPPATADSAIGSSHRVTAHTRATPVTGPTAVTGPASIVGPTSAAVRALGPRPTGNDDAVAPVPPTRPGPVRTTKPAGTVHPPVPTPTAPASSPSPTSSSPSPSASPSASASDNPSESPGPRKSRKPGHHRWER
jgi:hypothetical protein